MDMMKTPEPEPFYDLDDQSEIECAGDREDIAALQRLNDRSASCIHDAARMLNIDLFVLLGDKGRRRFLVKLAHGQARGKDAWAAVEPLMQAAVYGRYGATPYGTYGDVEPVASHRVKVAACIQQAQSALMAPAGLLAPYREVWRRVVARESLDFGDHLSVTDLVLLADTSEPEVEEEISRGVIAVDAHNRIPVTPARSWLDGRPGFRRSRWQDPTDSQSMH